MIARPPDPWLQTVLTDLRAGRRVRRALPEGGQLHVEADRPFLCVYRSPTETEHAPLARAVRSQAAWLTAFSRFAEDPGLSDLVSAIGTLLDGQHGGFLLLEIWEAPHGGHPAESPDALQPAFEIQGTHPGALEALRGALAEIRLGGRRARVTEDETARTFLHEGHRLGLGVGPIYRSARRGRLYPSVVTILVRAIHDALLAAEHAFVTQSTRLTRPRSRRALAREGIDHVTHRVDQRISAVSRSFDFLLEVTPINTQEAWRAFEAEGCTRPPRFLYRPATVDPPLAKRTLYDIEVEQVEDLEVGALLREKQLELDRRITMVQDRGTRRFLLESLQLYGPVEPALLGLARRILGTVLPEERPAVEPLEARTIAARAREEIAAYSDQVSDFQPAVHLRSDVGAGLMVAQGSLLVATGARVPEWRLDALLQHEIGTHLVTWYNGTCQPLALLRDGLAGYEGFQEGLSVLAEHLVGGLTRARLRLLAGRVIAAHTVIEGADFLETWHHLRGEHAFDAHTAFVTAMRVHRGGGFTKDAIYLRGLARVLRVLAAGASEDSLWIGKIASRHLPIVEALRDRSLLRAPPLRPRFLERPEARERLATLRQGVAVADLVLGT